MNFNSLVWYSSLAIGDEKNSYVAVGLEYFDKEKGEFIMIEANKLDIGENQVTARFADYELGFQMIVFDGDTKPSMTMSKYDFKNNRFLEHYKCDVETDNIE